MSDNTKKRLFDHKFDIVAFILIAGIFIYFMIFNEVVDCGDSFQYANQLPMREPVYSLLIQLFQTISGESYRIPLGIFQNILAIICIYWTYRRISRIYDFRSLFRIATLALLLAPHIITPLASKTNLVLTSTVMTEGITISLYYVWFTVLIGILWEHYSNKKDMILAVTVDTALGLILAMTRGQMVICLVVELLVICFKLIEQKNNTVKKRLISILICFLIFFVITGVKGILTKAYNYAETGYFVKTVSSGPMLLANIVYVSDENDAEYLADEDLRQAYIRIVREIDEEDRPQWLIYENVKGMLSSNGGKDFLAILTEMDELGYDAEWSLFNSKDWGVPQSRERVYTVGHLRRYGPKEIFPLKGADGKNSVPIKRIAHSNNFRRYNETYDPSGIVECLDTGSGGGHNPYVPVEYP